MTTSDIISSEIDSASITNFPIMVGRIIEFDPVTQRVNVFVERASGNKKYGNLTLPDAGLGIRLAQPSLNQLVIIGFIEGNSAAPVILSLLSGNGQGIEVHPDLSVAHTIGRLKFLQGL